MTDPPTVPDNKAAQCVRCGRRIAIRNYSPVFDANGVAWYECPRDCQPPEAFPATCVPLHETSQVESVFDPSVLNPDDALYEGPTDTDPTESEKEADAADSTDDRPEQPAYLQPRVDLQSRPEPEPKPTVQPRIRRGI